MLTVGMEKLVSRQPHKLENAGSSPAPAPYLVSINDEKLSPLRVLVTVCNVDGSCVDAARGVTATSTAIERGGN